MEEKVVNEKICTISGKMPKCTYTATFLVGYIQGKMEQVRKLVYRLENQLIFSMRELDNIRTELEEVEEEVQMQARMVKDERSEEKMKQFRSLMECAKLRRTGREQRLRAIEESVEQAQPSIQVGTVEPEMVVDRAPPTREDLDIYASDNEDEFPLEYMSTVRLPARYEPIRFDPPPADEPIASTSQQADLRDRLNHQRAVVNYNVQQGNRENSSTAGRGRGRGIGGRGVTVEPSQDSSTRSRSDIRGRAESVSSTASHATYASSRQERFDSPVGGRPMPKFASSWEHPPARNDPTLIGSTEIFVHPRQKDQSICPRCPLGKHLLFECTDFLRMGLQQRWYTALKLGVCLNCFRRGHSHFRCNKPGACWRCGTRHNSKLCPEGPNTL